MDPSPQATLEAIVAASPLKAKYAEVLDRESAYEKLAQRLQAAPPAAPAAPAPPAPSAPTPAPASTRAPKPEPNVLEQVVQSSAFRSMVRSAGTVIGREITRSLFGTRKR
jgi:hypothetical protein